MLRKKKALKEYYLKVYKNISIAVHKNRYLKICTKNSDDSNNYNKLSMIVWMFYNKF